MAKTKKIQNKKEDKPIKNRVVKKEILAKEAIIKKKEANSQKKLQDAPVVKVVLPEIIPSKKRLKNEQVKPVKIEEPTVDLILEPNQELKSKPVEVIKEVIAADAIEKEISKEMAFAALSPKEEPNPVEDNEEDEPKLPLIDLKPISKVNDPLFNQQKIEALLFSSGKKMEVTEISRLCGISPESAVIKCLNNLKNEYDSRKSALMIVDEGKHWKVTVREAFLSVVRKIVADTELSKSVMETLAVIAWKFPISQNSVIKIRTNKAYDHIKELEEMGFVKKERAGRTYALKLTDKFFSYFDVNGKKIKQMLSKVGQAPKGKEEKLGDLTVYTGQAPKQDTMQKSGEETIKIGPLEIYGAADKEKADFDVESREEAPVRVEKPTIVQKEDDDSDEKADDEIIKREVKGQDQEEEKESKDEDDAVDDDKSSDEDNEEESEHKEEKDSEDDEPKRVISDELANLLSNTPVMGFSKKKKKQDEDEEEEKEDDEEGDDK